MIKRLALVAGCGLSIVVLSSLPARAQDRHGNHLPAVPDKLQVDEGYSAFLVAHAVGTQNYACVPSAGGVAWRLVGPQATLFHQVGDTLRQQLTTHFLSANPEEAGLPRPTWQDSTDSSRVWGRMKESSDDPAFVQAGAIPWLLVEVTGAADGPTGGGFLSQAAFIHRVNTSGGAAPVTGCSQASQVGAIALSPYEADYVFYRRDGGR